MASSLKRLSSRMICACLLGVLLALSSASATESDSPQTPVAPADSLPVSASASPAQAANTTAQADSTASVQPSDPPAGSEWPTRPAQPANIPVSPAPVNAPSAAATSQVPDKPSQAPTQSEIATPGQGASSPAQAAANTAPVQPTAPQSEKSKPIFIVWAHTEIPDQGRPTLDLVDLERYFVNQLIQRRIENVGPSSTANIPNPSPNVYLIDLSIKAMHPAVRSVWNDSRHVYQDRDIFDVELSLAVTQRQSGRDLGNTGARYEHWFTNHYESEQVTEKRVAIYTAADELAERFTNAAAAGQFSEALTSIQASPPTFWENFSRGETGAVTIVVLGGLAILCIAVVIVASILSALDRVSRKIPPRPRPQPNYAAWDQELQEAFALSFETNGFDDAACQAVAYARCDEILASHASIEAKEAERVVSTKIRASEREKIAAYAISRCDLAKNDVIGTLQRAEEWPYRVLQEAKRLAVEVAQNV